MKNSNIRNQKLLQVSMLVGLSIVALFGCGARNTPAAPSADGSLTLASAIGPAATCNKALSRQGDAAVQLQAGANPSLIHLKFSKIPAGYSSGAYDIEIRKWTANAAGTVRVATDFPPVAFENHLGTSFSVISGFYSWKWNSSASMEWNVVKNCVTNASVDGASCSDAGNTDALTFFRDHTLLIDLADPNGDWKALQINFVDIASNTVVSTTDILIPTFDADPSIYAKNHAAVLSDLHPLKSLLNAGWPSTQYQTETNSYCF